MHGAIKAPASTSFTTLSIKSRLPEMAKPDIVGHNGDKAMGSPIRVISDDRQEKFERLRKENKELTTLNNIGIIAGSSLHLPQVIETVYKESRRLINTTNFAIGLYNEGSDTLDFVLVFNEGQRLKSFSIRSAASRGLTGQVLTGQTPLLVADLLEIRQQGGTGPVHIKRPVRSWLGAPIPNSTPTTKNAQGVIITWGHKPDMFTDHDLWLLNEIGKQASVAIANARLHQSVLIERDRVLAADTEARQKLARDLHDGATQLVSAVVTRLDFCKLLADREPTKLVQELVSTQELALQAVEAIRILLLELRPIILEMQGLAEALRTLLERRQKEVEGRTKLTLEIKSDQPDGQLSRQEDKVEETIFAIVQEALNNGIKHARAKNIKVELRETPVELYAAVIDDGYGFEVEEATRWSVKKGHLGMTNLRERADLIGCELTLESVPGQGTQITVRVPKSKVERMKKRGATGALISSTDLS